MILDSVLSPIQHTRSHRRTGVSFLTSPHPDRLWAQTVSWSTDFPFTTYFIHTVGTEVTNARIYVHLHYLMFPENGAYLSLGATLHSHLWHLDISGSIFYNYVLYWRRNFFFLSLGGSLVSSWNRPLFSAMLLLKLRSGKLNVFCPLCLILQLPTYNMLSRTCYCPL